MTDIWFYHLERQSIEAVLPNLVEKSLERNWRVVIEAKEESLVEKLDQWLWSYSPESFVPHGSHRDGNGAAQPVYLTCTPETPNEAMVRICVGGADPAGSLATGAQFERMILLIDGREPDAVILARQQWLALRAQQHTLSYWQQNEQGGWQKKV